MTQSEYEAELHFRLCKSIFATLAIRGIIGEDDSHTLLRAAVEKIPCTNWRTGGEQHCGRKRITRVEFPARTISRNSRRPQNGLPLMPEYPP